MTRSDPLALVEAVVRGETDAAEAWRTIAGVAGEPPAGAVGDLRAAVTVLHESGPWVALGAVPLALRWGVPERLLALVELEAMTQALEAGRVRVRLAARGWRREAGGTLVGPGGGTVLLRVGLLPRGWGRVPTFPFLEDAGAAGGGELRVPVPKPAAAWAAELLRLGIERLSGHARQLMRRARVALLEPELAAEQRNEWCERLRLWGAWRLARWALADEPPPPCGRLGAGVRLQDSPGGAFRFLLAQLFAGEEPERW